ncbi:hypothetical protein [Vibrio chagasii]|uniref:hypothetical protein n=1 Tax=Vibrio chagasii TaxID=170679 RepID=UPI003DA04892
MSEILHEPTGSETDIQSLVCTPTELRKVVCGQLTMAATSGTMEQCSPYLKQLKGEIEERRDSEIVEVQDAKHDLAKLSAYLQSKKRSNNALKLNGMNLMDKDAVEFAQDMSELIDSMREGIKEYEDALVLFEMYGI